MLGSVEEFCALVCKEHAQEEGQEPNDPANSPLVELACVGPRTKFNKELTWPLDIIRGMVLFVSECGKLFFLLNYKGLLFYLRSSYFFSSLMYI